MAIYIKLYRTEYPGHLSGFNVVLCILWIRIQCAKYGLLAIVYLSICVACVSTI